MNVLFFSCKIKTVTDERHLSELTGQNYPSKERNKTDIRVTTCNPSERK